jgi:tetraacyldisaccharide 4'-kinase
VSQTIVYPRGALLAPRPRPWLAPLGFLYGTGAATRSLLHRARLLPGHRLEGPVISVGNLSLGGRGKTPLVALVAGLLREAGFPVAVLSRGHGGTFRGESLIVGDGERVLADAVIAGDEPVMLARALSGVVVAVGRRRDRVGAAVERHFGRRVHVLDDGFQHLRLRRDLDLVCVTAGDLRDRPLPAGSLRERPSALSRADLVLFLNDDEEGGTDLPAALSAGRTFRLRRRVLGVADGSGAPCPPPRRPFLLAGIASPERFVADARRMAGDLAGQALFPDHHRFTTRELDDARRRARQSGADALLTTAKDLERLPRRDEDPPLRVLRIAVEVEEAALFRERLLAVAGTLA